MYDVIAIYQNPLQEKILCAVVDQYFPERKITFINLSDSVFCIPNGNRWTTNLYGITNIFKTIVSLRKNLPLLQCKDLIGSFITSYNSFLLPSIIQHDRLHLIDDGIGTPVIIKHPEYWNKKLKLKMKNLYLKVVLKQALNITLFSPSRILREITSYFSIYPLSGIKDARLKPTFLFFGIDKTIQQASFIGQPVLEYQLISRKKFKNNLISLVEKYGQIKYYLHPREKKDLKPYIQGVTYIYLKGTMIEEYFKMNGLPEYIYSFASTALLNLSLNIPRTSLFYIREDKMLNTSRQISNEYYNILELSGVKEYNFPQSHGKQLYK